MIRIAIYLVVRNFIFVDFLAVKVNGSDVKPGICLITPQCFNIQTSHGFKNFCLFSSNSTCKYKLVKELGAIGKIYIIHIYMQM